MIWWFIFGLIGLYFLYQSYSALAIIICVCAALGYFIHLYRESDWKDRRRARQIRAQEAKQAERSKQDQRQLLRDEEKKLADLRKLRATLPSPDEFIRAAYAMKPIGITALPDPRTATQYAEFHDHFFSYVKSIGVPETLALAETYKTMLAYSRDFDIPDAQRFAGTWIVAPSGRGKTNLLHNLIATDRPKGTVVLMDSKGDLINAYRNVAHVIEPATANINPLQLGSGVRTVEFLEYIFSALLETQMTALQKTLFRSVLTLLLRVPNATLETFRQVLTNGWKPYADHLADCDPATQDFFQKGEFDSKTYSETKQQILWRLRLILSNDYLRAIFTAPTTNVPFAELLDSRKLIIIDNSKDELGEDGAEFFGRFFVAITWMAAVSRSKLRPEDKVPVYFYIDEAHTVIRRDDKIATILDECRSQKIALTLAHQRIAQITSPNVLDALGNCAVRIANSDDDAAQLAPRFRVEPQQLRLPIGQFACYVRDQTPQAVTVSVPLLEMAQFPKAMGTSIQIAPQRPTDPPKGGVEDF
jgi:hypothetical protein